LDLTQGGYVGQVPVDFDERAFGDDAIMVEVVMTSPSDRSSQLTTTRLGSIS
jgi:hypothetical protein